MEQFLFQTIKVFVALFIITDSVGNLPFFMGMTEGMEHLQRRKIFTTALLTGAFVLAVFGIAGTLILDLFNLTMDDFRIGGGILLLIISIEILLRGKVSYEHKEDVGVVPLGCPLLVGPGAVATTLMFLNIFNPYAVIAGVGLCFLAIWIILYFAEHIYRILGHNGALIITKIAAIMIAAIAVRFIRVGIQSVFHV
ncbi:MAG: MarC family protein [Candidatus Margulisbacteria bacterium]|nr:MarC family protein [Candidatus Margulisiibacteriota bacterium]